jgi:LmbE family N-acetylglucosaminyl deacetylase
MAGRQTHADGGGDVRPVLVTLHAHPDDEAIFTGGTIAAAVGAGWRVVLVVATDGDLGLNPSSGGPDLATRRRAETLAAASILGIDRVEFLGYGDSGYPTSELGGPSRTTESVGPGEGTLSDAVVGRAADAVRRILVEEDATALTGYDANGIYGHIDHVRVHEIAARSVVGTDCELYEATINRAELRTLRHRLLRRGLVDALWPSALIDRIGVEPAGDLVGLDVGPYLDTKVRAIAAHSSQVLEATSFMGLPAGVFHHLFDTEWYRVDRRGAGRFFALVGSPEAVEACDARREVATAH